MITIFALSNGKNLGLANVFAEHFIGNGQKAQVLDVVDLGLPLYTSNEEKRTQVTDVVAPLLPYLAAEGFVFIGPEYNGGPPPTFTNLLAWISRSAKDWRIHLNEKRAAVATYSGGGGHHALMHMRQQLAFVGMNVIGREINVNDRKALDPASLEAVCRQLMR